MNGFMTWFAATPWSGTTFRHPNKSLAKPNRCPLNEISSSSWRRILVHVFAAGHPRALGGDPIGKFGVEPPLSKSDQNAGKIMTTQTRENSTAENGVPNQTKVSETDVSRGASELETRQDGKHDNTKVQVQFKVAAGQAKSVSVAGTFNGWNPETTPLKKNGEAWKRTIALPRGRHEYRFVVDGQWVTDPNAAEAVPNPFGSSNSVLSV
jgi:hypothetical protein